MAPTLTARSSRLDSIIRVLTNIIVLRRVFNEDHRWSPGNRSLAYELLLTPNTRLKLVGRGEMRGDMTKLLPGSIRGVFGLT
jgi:hypothetical protein